MSKAIDRLTDDEVLALYRLIQREGRYWRAVLDVAWIEGKYPADADVPTLQNLRNKGGPSLVAKLKHKDIVAAGQEVEKAYGQVSA